MIVVQPWNNSDENINTARLIENQLCDLGYKISPQANFTLSFDSKSTLGKWSSSSRNTSVELKAESSTANGKDAEVRLNLFSSSEGGVLNPNKTPGENILSKVSLEITLNQKNSPRLWQGEAIAGVHQTDTVSVARRLTPVLLDYLGKTISRKSVNIP